MKFKSLFFAAVLFAIGQAAVAAEVVKTQVHDYEMSEITKVAGGDADIDSQSGNGRGTTIHVQATNIRLDNSGKAILVDVLYGVREVHSNNTHLQKSETVTIALPQNWNVKRIGDNTTELDHSETIEGKQHGWIDITSNTAGTVAQNCQVKIDGPGRDDQGNARLKLKLVIPVVIEE